MSWRTHLGGGFFPEDDRAEFIMAIETYKKVNKRMFPTWTEVLEVIQQLGYRKVEARNIRMEDVPEPKLRKTA